MDISDLIKEIQQAGLSIDTISIAPDGSARLHIAQASRPRRTAANAVTHRRVGRPPKNGRRRKRGRPRKAEAASET